MTLRVKLALLFAALGLVVSVMVGGFAFRATRAELFDTTDQFLQNRASEIAVGNRQRPGRTRPADRAAAFSADLDSITQVVDEDGAVVGRTADLPVTDNVSELATLGVARGREGGAVRFDSIVVDGQPYRMVSIALPDGGAVQVARSIAEADTVTSALTRRFALIAALVSVASAALGWLIASRATAPLRRLAAVAGDVAETGDFTIDVDGGRPTRNGPDEIGQLSSSFKKMLAALEESREQQHRLVHDAGHELRTPLTSLRANVELLERAGDMPDQDRREVLSAVKSELVELSSLFDEMIELATDQRSAAVDLVALDMDVLVRDVVARWERRVDREITLDSTSAMVNGDADMLDRAVTNLLANAHKFSPPGQPIDVIALNGSVVVRDRGPGVPVGERERIFDRFYRSERTQSMPGSGLGLAIVAQVVDHHGGTVSVADAPGGGAEIGFSVPLHHRVSDTR